MNCKNYKIMDGINIKDFVGGMILSGITWEVWENTLIALIVALVGGFMAAAGRQLHKTLYECIQARKKRKEQENDIA